MQICLKNFGILRETDIEMPGLAVVVGENETGRHTLCRAVFTLTDLFGGRDGATTGMQREAVLSAVESFYDRWKDEEQSEFDLTNIDRRLNRAALRGGCPAVRRELYEWTDECGMGYDDEVDALAQSVTAVFQGATVPPDAVENVFWKEFRAWLPRAGQNEKTMELQLTQNGERTDVRFSATDGMLLQNAGKRRGQALWLGTDVSAAWDLVSRRSVAQVFFPERINRVLRALEEGSKRDLNPAVKVLSDEWQAFCGGSLRCGFMETSFKPLTGEAEYPPLAISAGLKVPVVCAALLADGVIREGDTVIWEEPESHLHPRLQVRLAELLVKLQKALQLHVLITTNSPYLVSALEIYGRKYGMADDGRWYLTEKTDSGSVVRNVTGHVHEIYDALAAPCQTVEDEAMALE